MIVVDASFLTDYLLGRLSAHDVLDHEIRDFAEELLHAPDLIELETLNVLRRLLASGQIDELSATAAIGDLESVRLLRHPHAQLRARVWELRHNLSAYDASYLALAEVLDDPVLLTRDSGLAAAACASLGDDRVRHVP